RDVDPAPWTVRAMALRAPVTGRAAVVHVDQRETAAGPVLILERIGRTRRAGRPAVTVHDQRRLLALRRLVILVARRVVEGVRGQTLLARKLDRLRDAEVARLNVPGV